MSDGLSPSRRLLAAFLRGETNPEVLAAGRRLDRLLAERDRLEAENAAMEAMVARFVMEKGRPETAQAMPTERVLQQEFVRVPGASAKEWRDVPEVTDEHDALKRALCTIARLSGADTARVVARDTLEQLGIGWE